jgi:hypothetical protein
MNSLGNDIIQGDDFDPIRIFFFFNVMNNDVFFFFVSMVSNGEIFSTSMNKRLTRVIWIQFTCSASEYSRKVH